MGTKLKILTLNCWGVFTPLACQHRSERMEAIGKELAQGQYDLVLLQEVWTQSDYEGLCTKICTVMQHTHYFSSGMFGSGLCMFSKFPILETFQHNFTLNGYAHKVAHGDWFCGKSVGLAKLLVNDFRVNVYVTHTHASYTPTHEDYQAHRIVQAYELGQFVKMTSEGCDALIIGGDFNLMPSDLGYKMIRCNAVVKDAWIEQKTNPGHVGTAERPDNYYYPNSKWPDGKCLDFLMFRTNSGCELVCDKCSLTMGKIPEVGYNYSDHEGVVGDFTIKRNLTAMGEGRDSGEVEKQFSEALPLLDNGLKKVKADQVYYMVALFIGIVALVFTGGLELPLGLGCVLALARCGLVLGVAFCFWSGVVMANREMNGIIAARKDINNMLRSNPVM